MSNPFKKVDWKKWGKVGIVIGVSALGIPELQSVLPGEALPYVNAALAAWALLHKYQAQAEQTPKPETK